MSEGLVLTYRPARSAPRRASFEPRTPDGYSRVTEVWTGCKWRIEGREPVADLQVEVDGSVIDVIDIVNKPGGDTVTGP